MIKDGEPRPHVEGRPVHRVSSAAWPLNVRRVVATDKAAQRRRDWIMQGRWMVVLADALSMRALLVLTPLLVVVSSLFVAVLGLQFWYLLLLPLLLFGLLLTLPTFLASRMPMETAPSTLATFAQEFKSSTGLLSLYTQELRSSPGFLQDLRSSPGFLQELKSHPGFLQGLKSHPGFLQELRSQPGLLSAESPATPMPVAADPPLVRVLETYDLRQEQVKHFLGSSGMSDEETNKHAQVHMAERDSWPYTLATEQLETDNLSASDLDEQAAETHKLSIDESSKSEAGE